jgi:PKD repeat protein
VANPNANPASTTTYTVSVHRGTPSCAATSQVTVTVNTPAALSITPAGSTNICPGQSVSLSGTAGFTNYTWTLPGGGSASGQTITASQIGSYSLTATGANGCQSTASPVNLTAGNAASIEVTANGPLTFCEGQSVTLTAAAGFTNYVWSNGAQGSVLVAEQAGTYSVSAEGGTCGGISDDVVVSVSPAQALSIIPSGSIVLCQGETVTLVAQAGFTNYVWSTNESGNELEVGLAGLYSVSATDENGCTAVSSNVNVSINPVFNVDVTPSGTISLCDGESITLTAQSGFSNYVWSNSVEGPTLTVNSPGFYSVSAFNAEGCQGSSQIVNVSIIDVGDINFTWIQTDDPIYTIQFTSSVDANTYLWDFGVAGATSTEANPSFTYPFDGSYTVTLTVETDCGDGNVSQDIDVIKTSIESIAGLNHFNLKPSADGNGLIIDASHSGTNLIHVQLLDLSGRILMSDAYTADKSVNKYLNVSELSSGLYFVCLSDGQNYVARKWVK